MMNKITAPDYETLSARAAEIVIDRIKQKPDLVLGLATGSTPLGLYQRLIESYQNGKISFTKITSFNLDEYCGLNEKHPQSYHYFMNKNLFDLVDMDKSQTHFPSCRQKAGEYDRQIEQAGGIDLQILGIGRNGHIAFNEPGSSLNSKTRTVNLTPTTVSDNARFFKRPEDVPTKAATMGLSTIMQAKEIILLATGSGKRTAITKLFNGGVTERLPASILSKHSQTTVIYDREAYND